MSGKALPIAGGGSRSRRRLSTQPPTDAASAATLPRVSATDAVYRAGYRVLFRLALLYWRVRRPRLQGAYVAVWHGERVLLVQNSYRRKLSLPAGGSSAASVRSTPRAASCARRSGSTVRSPPLRYVGEIVDETATPRITVTSSSCAAREPPTPVVDRREVVWAGWLLPDEALARAWCRW